MKTKIRSPLTWFIVVLSSVALIGFAFTPALADESGATGDYEVVVPEGSVILDQGEGGDVFTPEAEESFGQSSQATWIAAQEFDPMDSGITWNRGPIGIGSFRCRTGGGNLWFDAPIRLPSGARLSIMRLFYLDNAAGNVTLWLHRTRVSETPGVAASVAQLGPLISSGGGYGNVAGAYNQIIANRLNIYSARLNIGTGVCVIGVRLFWNRQIRTGLSHPFIDLGGLNATFINSIAAMAQSGITVGTSPVTFSPNNPVTRGQMAVFLARALGLYWAYGSGY